MNAWDRHRHQPCRPKAPFGRIVLLIVVAATQLTAQQHILIRSIRGDHVSSRPGGMITLPVRIINTGSSLDHIALFLRHPPGWRQVTQPQIASISPGDSALRLVTLSPSKNATAGSYTVQLSAIDSTHRWGERLIPLTVTIERQMAFEVVQVDAPRLGVGGNILLYEYDVLNKGNDMLTVSVDARSAQNFRVDVNPPLLRIPIGDGARISISVTSPSELPRREKHALILTVTPSEGGEPQSLTTLTDIFPRIGSTEPDRLEFPVFGSLRLLGDNDHRGVQAEIGGFGSLRQDRSDRLEFRVRTPQTQTVSVLGALDEYRLRYTHGPLQLRAGDWNYSLTTLTEVGRYAFGVGGETIYRNVSVGGFANTTRINSPSRQQIAGYTRFDVTTDLTAGINILHRNETNSATILSTNLTTSPFRKALLDVETGISSGSGKTDGALSARLTGNSPIGQYELRLVNAGRDFASYYRDVQLALFSLTGYAFSNVRLDLLARDERRNGRLDTLVGFAPHAQFIQVGGGYANLFSLYYRSTILADPLSPSGQDRREDVMQIRATRSLSVINISAYADLGTLTDRAAQGNGPTRRYALDISAQPGSGQSYSSNVEYSKAPDLANNVSIERVAATLTANYRIGDDTRAQVIWFISRTLAPVTQRFSIIDASLDHVFPSHHRAGARVRSTSISESTSELAFSLEYGMPLAVPLGNIQSSGVLSGRLIDDKGNGIEGVYLTVGDKASVTDETGLFAMRDLPPGTYLLNVDRGTLGLERILDVPLPFEVTVVGGEEMSVVLHTVTPGLLQGTTKLFNSISTGIRDSVLIREEPVEGNVGIIVDITNGEDRFRRITNSRGVFVFTDLRPGVWKISYAPLRLPDDHVIERRKAVVEIKAGESSLVTVRVIPQQRRIRILQEGGVLKPKN